MCSMDRRRGRIRWILAQQAIRVFLLLSIILTLIILWLVHLSLDTSHPVRPTYSQSIHQVTAAQQQVYQETTAALKGPHNEHKSGEVIDQLADLDDTCPVFKLISSRNTSETVTCKRADFVPGSCRIMKTLFNSEPANCSHKNMNIICEIKPTIKSARKGTQEHGTRRGTQIPGNDFDTHGTLSTIFSTILSVMLALVVFSLGCTVEASKLWSHLRRPWGIVIGLICQFGLMPLIAYLLALGFSVKPTQAVAILIMGCCPGGVISNIITLWVDGDMDLSLSMTSCSTILALGMMPFCLFIYSRSWELAKSIRIPYYNIGMALLSVVVPVGVGVYVNYKWPKKAKIISKAGSIIGGLLMLVIGIASSVLYKGSWNTDISILIIGIIYPLLGYITGFGMAIIVRQPWQRCRTIALETGAQNVQMCSTVLQLSFTPKQLVQMFTFPLIYASFQFLNGMLFVAAYQLYKRKYWKANEENSIKNSERCIKINEMVINGNINPNFEIDEDDGVKCAMKENTLNNDVRSDVEQLSEISTLSKDTFL